MRPRGGIIGATAAPSATSASGIWSVREAEAFSRAGAWPAMPSAPTAVSGTPGDTKVVLAWTAPASSGGYAITNYLVQYSSDSGSNWTTVSRSASTATNATVTGLVNGTAYVFRVAAVTFGAGGYSSASSAVTPVLSSILTYANSFVYPAAGSVSYSLSGTTTVTAILNGSGDATDARLWLLIGKTGTLSYSVTASSEQNFDGGRLFRASASPSQHSVLSGLGTVPGGLTIVSASVSGSATSTGTASVTSGEYLVLVYTQDSSSQAGANRITATLSIA